MPAPEPTQVKNLDPSGVEPLAWSRARETLERANTGDNVTWFLATTDPDGRSHMAGVGAAYHEGSFYFQSSPKARKARNLESNAACSLGVHAPGIDIVAEGNADRVTDTATLADVVKIWNESGWPAVVEGDALNAPFNAPSAGPPPWYVYRIRPHHVYGVAGEEPHGATRWTFA